MNASTLLTPATAARRRARSAPSRVRACPSMRAASTSRPSRHAGECLDSLGPVRRRDRVAPPRILGAAPDVVRSISVVANRARGAGRWRAPHQSPGASGRCSVAHCAVGVRRGSATISAPPLALLRLEVPHDGRHRLGQVAADEQDRFGVRNVGERKRQARDRSRTPSTARRRGRRHAESAVVVDVRRAQRDARELSEQIRLLVRQRAAAEHGDGVRPYRRCTSPKLRCHVFSATSHVVGSSRPLAFRMSGARSRSG